MIGKIKGESVEIPVTTVSIAPAFGEDVSMFHCPNCGESVVKYQGFVTKIYPYLEPSPEVVTLNRCRKCRQSYRFLTHHGSLSKSVKVILFHSKMGISHFYCYEDRYIVVTYNEKTVFTGHEQEITLPSLVHCPSPTCAVEYLFTDLV